MKMSRNEMVSQVRKAFEKIGAKLILNTIKKGLFIISRDRNKIRIALPTSAQLAAFPDKDQLILDLREEKRTIKAEDPDVVSSNNLGTRRITRLLGIRFSLPEEARIHITGLKKGNKYIALDHEIINKSNYFSVSEVLAIRKAAGEEIRNIRLVGHVEIPESHMSFLIGYDVDHLGQPFISRLPKVCKSVEEAHKCLRPKGLPSNTIRLAEFFLIPVNRILEKKLDKALDTQIITVRSQGENLINRTPCSLGLRHSHRDHIASISIYLDKKQYAMGSITSFNHQVLILDKWHRVVRNLEIETDSDSFD